MSIVGMIFGNLLYHLHAGQYLTFLYSGQNPVVPD
jgi:hypothetical protein